MAAALPYQSLPADGYAVRWATWDAEHTEQLTLAWENEAWTAAGRVGGADVEYVIRLSPLWQTRQVLLFRDLPEPDLWLGTDGRGHWGEVNGAHRPELDGTLDVALAVTPFTHALPIRRLAVPVGAAATVVVLTVDVETLAIVPELRTYRRLAEHAWAVTTPTGELSVGVDAHGIPTDVAGHWRRVDS